MSSIIMSSSYSPLLELLRQQLLVARQLDQQAREALASGTLLEVPMAGKMVSSAYEQLRNAAEYAEEHLLLERAIKRFCKRNLFLAKRRSPALGAELIVELVQAGYLQGNEFSKATAGRLDRQIDIYLAAFGHLRQAHVKHNTAMDWVLAHLASDIESTLNPHHAQQATVSFAYHYFLQAIPRSQFANSPEAASYEFCLYIAVHQALLKSDIDIIRYQLLVLYKQSPHDTTGFKRLNEQIDAYYASPLTQQLKRLIGRSGAPFRVLRSLIDDRADVADILPDRELFMDAYNRQITREYKGVEKRLDRGLVKSIVFIFITKIIIGVAIEVPYDLVMRGTVALLPLGLNLLFPPLYMASLKLSMRLPSSSNASALSVAMDQLLYEPEVRQLVVPPARISSAGGKIMYTLLFAIPVTVTWLILQRTGFNIVQMIIFFVFFSTASFLGFRLSTLVRDLELETRQAGVLVSLRGFFYLPFIVAGQWLSRKYNKVNAVGRFLDVAIELPLKALLRLLRQWIRFLNEKHEELY